jgi:enamine deaminase RidA (YjgF/YER057c/UK114 family)
MALERISPGGLHTAEGYTHVVKATGSKTVYVSGQVGIDPDGSVAEGLRGQARQAFSNLVIALESAGATPSDIAKMTVYVVNYSAEAVPVLFSASPFDESELPATTLIGVQALFMPEVLVEIEAIAVLD